MCNGLFNRVSVLSLFLFLNVFLLIVSRETARMSHKHYVLWFYFLIVECDGFAFLYCFVQCFIFFDFTICHVIVVNDVWIIKIFGVIVNSVGEYIYWKLADANHRYVAMQHACPVVYIARIVRNRWLNREGCQWIVGKRNLMAILKSVAKLQNLSLTVK